MSTVFTSEQTSKPMIAIMTTNILSSTMSPLIQEQARISTSCPVNSLKCQMGAGPGSGEYMRPHWKTALLWVAVLMLTLAGCVYAPQEEAYVPPPDPQDLLSESATQLREVRSLKFVLTHERGSIYYLDAGAHIKATDVSGEWDAVAGLSLAIDAYLVRDRDVAPESGTYFPLQMVLVSDGFYITDPLSGQWVLQSPELALIPVGALNEAMADLVSQIENPNLEGVEDIDGRETYRVSGRIPAATVDWLSIDLSENASADIILWIDRQDRLPRQVHMVGAIGEYDDPGTMRQLLLSDFNQSVRVDPPDVFIDVR